LVTVGNTGNHWDYTYLTSLNWITHYNKTHIERT
jgi:hypothetical protein